MHFLLIKVEGKSNAMDVSNGDTKRQIAQIKAIINRLSDILYHLKKKHSRTKTRSNLRQRLKLKLQM